MSLLLIRHGETDFNATRVVQFPDTPLGAGGLQQAERLGRHLAARRIGLVLTSDYRRARMTADCVARHTGATLHESPHLRERNFGELRGRSYDEFGDLDPFAPDYVPPAGESWDVFHARVDTAWAEVLEHAAQVSEDVAVVTHGLVLRSLVERVLDVSAHAWEVGTVVGNTAVTVVERVPPWRVTELASIVHLGEAPDSVAPV